MSEDATLGEFLGETLSGADEPHAESGQRADASKSEDGSAVEPARTTYQFAPAGASCANCGAEVQRRWDEDGVLVCPDCKEW